MQVMYYFSLIISCLYSIPLVRAACNGTTDLLLQLTAHPNPNPALPSLATFTSLLRSDPQLLRILSQQQQQQQQYTLFAPTDEAFTQQNIQSNDSMTADQVLQRHQVTLTDLLRYHILTSSFPMDQFPPLSFPLTLLASSGTNASTAHAVVAVTHETDPSPKLTVEYGTSGPRAQVTYTNITACNGVLHIVDRVLFPPKPMDQTLQDAGVTRFAALLQQYALAQELMAMQSLTVFAPSNQAWNDAGLEGMASDQVLALLKHHVVTSGVYYSTALPRKLSTWANQSIDVVANDSMLMVGSAFVADSDVLMSNGVVHVLHSVISL